MRHAHSRPHAMRGGGTLFGWCMVGKWARCAVRRARGPLPKARVPSMRRTVGRQRVARGCGSESYRCTICCASQPLCTLDPPARVPSRVLAPTVQTDGSLPPNYQFLNVHEHMPHATRANTLQYTQQTQTPRVSLDELIGQGRASRKHDHATNRRRNGSTEINEECLLSRLCCAVAPGYSGLQLQARLCTCSIFKVKRRTDLYLCLCLCLYLCHNRVAHTNSQTKHVLTLTYTVTFVYTQHWTEVRARTKPNTRRSLYFSSPIPHP